MSLMQLIPALINLFQKKVFLPGLGRTFSLAPISILEQRSVGGGGGGGGVGGWGWGFGIDRVRLLPCSVKLSAGRSDFSSCHCAESLGSLSQYFF